VTKFIPLIVINLVTPKAGAFVQQTGHRPLNLPAPAPVEMPRAAKAIFFPKPIAAIMEKRLFDQPEKKKKKHFTRVPIFGISPKIFNFNQWVKTIEIVVNLEREC
jgi:hypothetical protein